MHEKIIKLRTPRALEPTTPGSSAGVVPDVLARLNNRLYLHFSHREAPENLPDNPFEALRAWIDAYSLDRAEEQSEIEDQVGKIAITDEFYSIEINPHQRQPTKLVIATFYAEDSALMHGIFMMKEGAGVIEGVTTTRLPEEDIWIEGSMQRTLEPEQDENQALTEVLMDELVRYPLATRVVFTHCIIDQFDPSPPGSGNEMDLPLAA